MILPDFFSQRWVYKRGSGAGFTLIELLVVFVIMGILLSMSLLSVGQVDEERRLGEEAHRLEKLLGLAANEAIFSFQEWGLLLEKNSYSFLVQDRIEKWLSPEQDALWRKRTLPEGCFFTLEVEGEPLSLEVNPTALPQIYLYSSGELSPFVLTIEGLKGKQWRLSGSAVGEITLQEVSIL
ncbi:MAG: type II secretion system minor pseudopilin GspH [Magnetococcus sp. DMHC-6]